MFRRNKVQPLEETMSVNKLAGIIMGALSLSLAGAAFAQAPGAPAGGNPAAGPAAAAAPQNQSGRLRTGPPEDIFLEVTLAANGGLTLSENEFHLAWGGYYRFNLQCPA